MAVPVFHPQVSVMLKKNIGRATVSGQVASSQRFQGTAREIDLTPYLGDTGSVVVSKSVREPAGMFSVTLADNLAPGELESLYGVIEPMDVVEIRMARDTSKYAGAFTKNMPIMMRGFVTETRRSEVFDSDQFSEASRKYQELHGPLKPFSQYKPPPGVFWDDAKYQGDAYGAFAWAVYVAEVTVDLVTFETTVDDFVALQEVGRVIHPVLAAGQIEGGVAQAIGFALYEEVVWKDGRMINNQMTNYIMPTSTDLPPIRVFFEELGNVHGAFGAKGIGELPMDGPAPAILNAVEDALQIGFDSIPLLPEDIFEAMASQSVERAPGVASELR